MPENFQPDRLEPREGYISIGKGRLFFREIGQGQPIVILHGGPDFDHQYFLPAMDRLSKLGRLIYYDQRGRGRSGENIYPDQVTIQSEIEDLETVRTFFQFETIALLGHSWGGLLALEYAVHYPSHLSHLILLNTAPASHDDAVLMRKAILRKRTPQEIKRMKALRSSTNYAEGDLETDADYYRIHFRPTIESPETLERVVNRLRVGMTPADIQKARAIEDRLYQQTWELSDYNLLPMLAHIHIPTLIIHGDHDFVPKECALHIAEAIPEARFVLIQNCGHFSFIDCPVEITKELAVFLQMKT